MPTLPPVVEVVRDKCIGCHRCIAACPVKFANAAANQKVEVLHDRCIGCGRCILACERGARQGVDDLHAFLNDLADGVPVVAVVTPAVSASFPDTYLNLNGWLKKLGVAECFDAGFGAELAVRSLVEHMATAKTKCFIASSCPAVAGYCQLYRPELLPHLAPVHSPTLHAMRMIRRYWTRFARHRIAAVSPCFAKKRELVENGLGDYNVAMTSLASFLKGNDVNLGDFPAAPYADPPADLAITLSAPGGLTRTMERVAPGIGATIRSVSGTDAVRRCLDTLRGAIASGIAPLLIDCLNCEKGCNGGVAAPARNVQEDELDCRVNRRLASLRKARNGNGGKAGFLWKKKEADASRELGQSVDEFWEPGLYDRRYRDLSENVRLPEMDEDDRKAVLRELGKTEGDMCNCPACGYNSCETMIQAIHLGINRPENCLRRGMRADGGNPREDTDGCGNSPEKFGRPVGMRRDEYRMDR